MNAVAYIRFSTDDQSASLGQQRDVIERWAKENGHTIIDWITDDGVSGTLREDRRPGLGNLLEAVRNRNDFHIAVCYDLSRFGRFQDPNTYGFYFQQAHDARKQFYFIQDAASSKDNDIGKVILRVITAYGAGEKSRITASGAIRGQVARARRGRVVGGFPPYGFDHMILNQNDVPFEIHRFVRRGPPKAKNSSVWQILTPEGALTREILGPPPKQKSNEVVLVQGEVKRREVVEMIFHLYGFEGWGYRRVAHELNRLRIPSPLGAKWTMGAVREILYNPAYRGHAVFNRRSSAKVYRIANKPDARGNDHTKIVVDDFERGRTRSNPETEWVIKRGVFATFIPPDVLNRVDEKLDLVRKTFGGTGREPSGQNPRMVLSPALLSGFVICGKCGHHYRGHPWRKKRPGCRSANDYAYVCGYFKDGGSEACRKFYVPHELLEDPIVRHVRDRLVGQASKSDWEEDTRAVLREVFTPGAVPKHLETLEHRRDELKSRLAAFVRNISPDNMHLVNQELDRMRSQIEAIERELASPPVAGRAEFDIKAAVDEIWTLMTDFRENFDSATQLDRKRILRPFLQQVTVDPEKRRAEVVLNKIPLPVVAGGVLMKVGTPTGI